jgi:hypothetical protein
MFSDPDVFCDHGKGGAVKVLSLAIVGRGEGASCQGNGEMLGRFGLWRHTESGTTVRK